jgi:hypothetical protein
MSNTATVVTILAAFVAIQGMLYATFRHSVDLLATQLGKRLDDVGDRIDELRVEVRDELRELRRAVHAVGETVAEHEGRLKRPT